MLGTKSPTRAKVVVATVAATMVLATFVSCAARSAKTPPVSHRGRAIVVAVSSDKPRIKLNHEAIPGYMDAMTMWFEVKDAKMLEGLAPNDRVEFVLTEEEAADVITELKKVG